MALYHAWSDALCDNEKPPIEFPNTCLVGKYAMPVVYYVARWMLYSASKALTVAADKRQLYFRFVACHKVNVKSATDQIFPYHWWRREIRGHQFIVRESILSSN